MFDVGFLELLFLAIIGMVVIGPEKLPAVAKTVGGTVGKVKRFFNGMQAQIEQEIRLEELNKKIKSETEGLNFTNNNESEKKEAQHLLKDEANKEADSESEQLVNETANSNKEEKSEK